MTEYEVLKKKYDDLKAKQAQAEARRELYLDELRKLGCDTVEAAEARIAELEAQVQKTQGRVQAQLQDIREALDAI
jgi:multidrug efflux pump subunit AcrA (membrane-fusion protein)